MNIKEATPQNRPNYFHQNMAVRGAVGDLAGNSQVHLLGFTAYLTRHYLGQAEARTDNSTFAIGGISSSADSVVVAESFVLRINISGKKPAHRKSANRYLMPHHKSLTISIRSQKINPIFQLRSRNVIPLSIQNFLS